MSTTDADGLTTTTGYDGVGRKAGVASPLEHRTAYAYDEQDRLTGVTQGAEEGAQFTAVTAYRYDDAGPVRWQVDADGHAVERVYDAWDRVTELRQWFLPADQIPALMTGKASASGPGPNSQVPGPVSQSRASSPDFLPWTSAYDAVGNLLATVDPDGRRVDRTYDALNRLESESFAWPSSDPTALADVPLNHAYAYDLNDNLRQVVEEKDVRSDWAAAGAGVVSGPPGVRRSVAYTTRYRYDGLDRLEEQTDGYWGRTTRFGYDRTGSRTAMYFPGETPALIPDQPPAVAPSAAYRYDAAHRLVGVDRHISEAGKATVFSHGTGEPAKRRTGAAWSANFPPADGRPDRRAGLPPENAGPANLPLTAAGSKSTELFTDSPSSADSPIPPFPDSPLQTDSPVAAYTYLPDGLVDTITYQNGAVATWHYRDNGWVSSIELHDGNGALLSSYFYTYDDDGNRIAMAEVNATPARRAADPMWAAPRETTYGYDHFGRLTWVKYPAMGADAPARRMDYTYDLAGNRLTETEVELDGAGHPVRTIKQRAFTYNALNQVEFIRDELAPARSVRYEYDLSGDTTAKIIGALDADGEVVPGTEVSRLNFAWDAAGRLRRVTRQVPTTGKYSGSAGPGTPAGKVASPSVLGEEELVAEFAYDYAGRRVRHDGRFVYLGDGAGGPGDPVPADIRFYVYDQQSGLAEYAPDPAFPGDPAALVKTRQYLYGNELIAAESVPSSPESPAPSPVFYHQDSLGSTINLTGPDGAATAGYLYDAWGNYRELDVTDPANPGNPIFNATPDLGPDGLYAWDSYLSTIQFAFDPASLELPAPSLADWNRFTYTGHEFDPETGLYYFKARFYDPELGRFASEDPYLGDFLTPPSLHRYLYAYANSTRFVDLTGYASATDDEPWWMKVKQRHQDLKNWFTTKKAQAEEKVDDTGARISQMKRYFTHEVPARAQRGYAWGKIFGERFKDDVEGMILFGVMLNMNPNFLLELLAENAKVTGKTLTSVQGYGDLWAGYVAYCEQMKTFEGSARLAADLAFAYLTSKLTSLGGAGKTGTVGEVGGEAGVMRDAAAAGRAGAGMGEDAATAGRAGTGVGQDAAAAARTGTPLAKDGTIPLQAGTDPALKAPLAPSRGATATQLGTRRLPNGDNPWIKYQKHVTGRSFEEMWRLNVDKVGVDATKAGYTVEAKWAGRNDAAWRSSPYNPRSEFYNEKAILDQARNLIELNKASGGKGVRYAISNDAARAHFDALFRQHFPGENIQVWHVPGTGMK